jgi:uncharacterized protein
MDPELPSDERLLPLFLASGRNVVHVAELLHALLTRWPDEAGLLAAIAAAEHEGDRLVHDIHHGLAGHGCAPFDATDVHALAGALDDIVDYADDAATRLSLYRVEAAMDQAIAIAAILLAAARELAAALNALDHHADPAPRLIEIHRLENDADQLVRGAVAALFADGIDPMTVIRWKDIFETLEAAVDACETVANLLEGAYLKSRTPRTRTRTRTRIKSP